MLKFIKKSLKVMGITIGVILILLFIIGYLFIKLSPQFGGQASKEDIKKYEASGHYKDGAFINLIPTSMDMSFGNMKKTIGEFIKGTPNARPSFELPIQKTDSIDLTKNLSHTELIWFGHSAFLMKMDSKIILIDPMLGDVPAPHPWLGNKRYYDELPIDIDQLPSIDAIIISHDHYDHLDYGSIKRLKGKTKRFFVPLGVKNHFIEWGVDPNDIEELNWWDETSLDKIQLVFTPSRHFSGRGISDRNATLWGSWVIKGSKDTVYFSGDSGYGPHFKEIGEKYGPFDFAMMECGQYNEKWSMIHMMPEETAQAAVDLNAKVMMPIHWGAFTLALHSWTDPVIRVSKKANELNQAMITPVIGEHIILDDDLSDNSSNWWEK